MKIGFLHLLTLLFVAAKLTKLITWSWWLVFAPTILHVALFIAAIICLSIVQAIKNV